MSKITRFIIWICSKFTRAEIGQIIAGLSDILNNHNPDIKPKDDFKEKHPNYRAFSVDPLPPLTEPPPKKPAQPYKDYKLLLAQYEAQHGKPLNPVKQRPSSPKVPSLSVCPLCNAPHIYIYYNDGNKRTQLKCKVCGHLFQLNQRFRKNDKSKFFCPYCHCALFRWKQRKEVTIYKCSNDNCSHRIEAINKLNPNERSLQKKAVLNSNSATNTDSIITNQANLSIHSLIIPMLIYLKFITTPMSWVLSLLFMSLSLSLPEKLL